ncbi:hypothetical protein AN958_06910 [Leucoagaricus sp. SymC.cos]|nr:hypothetical protein AN958_06910 [Leucoagaricus sp. SymC.cos]
MVCYILAPSLLFSPMKTIWQLLVLLLLVTPSVVFAQTNNSAATHVVDIGYAKYEGILNNQTGNLEFLGMRYAASPTGEVLPSRCRARAKSPGLLVQVIFAGENHSFQRRPLVSKRRTRSRIGAGKELKGIRRHRHSRHRPNQ